MSDEIEFLPEDGPAETSGPAWKVLVVDDDAEIHHVTRLVLNGITFHGQPIHTLTAASAEEARALLEAHPDVAIILLDVVMETENAGLDLVRWVREDKGMTAVRIILRTGQPGQAPERDVVLRYDINDYKSKTEMTAQKLLTATVSGLRGFEAIRGLEISRAGLADRAATSEAQATAILQAVPEGVITMDAGGLVRSFSPAAERLFGWTAEEMIGQPVGRLMPAEEAERHDGYVKTYVETGRGHIIGIGAREVEGLRRDGSTFPMDLSVNAAEVAGRRLFVATVRDTTERRLQQRILRRAKEEAEQAAQAKSEFLAMMSHEIRTPLNGILGMVQVLRDSGLTATQEDYAATIQESGQDLLAVLNDILDFSNLEAGRLDLDQAPLDIAEFTREIAAVVGRQAADKGLSFDLRLGAGLPATLVGDRARLRQVVFNLASNALKFTDRGGIFMAVDATPEGLVRFNVTDTGIGIAEDAKGRLFNHFAQADSFISRRYGGTGLGLAIAKKIVLLMGGEIGVESLLGEGSTFWFVVPVTPGAARGAPAVAASEEGDAAMPPLRVLIIEDGTAATAADGLLAEGGHEIVKAGGGRPALEMMRGQSFDIVLMDLDLPGMDGVQATRAIRDLGGPAAQAPIVALAGPGAAADEERCLAAGMDGYLRRPLDARRLGEAMRRAMEHRRRAVGEARKQAAGWSSLAVSDDGVLADLRQALGEREVAELLGLFASDARRLLTLMRQNCAAGNRDAVRDLAHDLLATSGNFGFPRLGAGARDVAAAAEVPDLGYLARLIDDLAAGLDDTLSVVGRAAPGGGTALPARDNDETAPLGVDLP
jgi:PAS domain S-box-containing protein